MIRRPYNGTVVIDQHICEDFPEQVKHLRQILADLESGEIWKTEMEQSGITF